MPSKIEKIVKKQLRKTVKHCDFKKAFLREGWTCVNINKFAKCLGKEIKDGLRIEKRRR